MWDLLFFKKSNWQSERIIIQYGYDWKRVIPFWKRWRRLCPASDFFLLFYLFPPKDSHLLGGRWMASLMCIYSSKQNFWSYVKISDKLNWGFLLFRFPDAGYVSGNQHTAFHSHSVTCSCNGYECVRCCKRYWCIQTPTSTLADNFESWSDWAIPV